MRTDELNPVACPLEPLRPLLDFGVECSQEPRRPTVLPHAFVIIQERAVAVTGQEVSPVLVIQYAGKPKWERVLYEPVSVDAVKMLKVLG